MGKVRKRKITRGQMKIHEQQLREYNLHQKRTHQPKITMDEWLDKVYGAKKYKKEFVEWKSGRQTYSEKRCEDMRNYKSCVSGAVTDISQRGDAKKESPMYTGTYVKGIATMHKSNAVPVADPQHAIDIARMAK